jgi:hypothetical protein
MMNSINVYFLQVGKFVVTYGIGDYVSQASDGGGEREDGCNCNHAPVPRQPRLPELLPLHLETRRPVS